MSGGRETDSGVQDQPGNSGSIGARLVAARNRRLLTQESVARQLRLDAVSYTHLTLPTTPYV